MLKVIMWDVQQGNAIYMKTPNGRNIMFDIGTGSYENGREFSPLRHLKNQGEYSDCVEFYLPRFGQCLCSSSFCGVGSIRSYKLW